MRKIFLIFTALCVSLLCFSQEKTSSISAKPFIKNQMNISLTGLKKGTIQGGFQIETLYGISDWLEVGAFCDGRITGRENYIYYHHFHLGASAKAHLLPAIIKPSFRLVDLYGNAQLGGCLSIPSEMEMSQFGYKTKLQGYWSVGVGAAINLSRHFGLFYEWKYDGTRETIHMFGINIRFAGPKKWQKTE